MPKPTVKVWLDDGSGTFAYDVTPYVDMRKGISINRGRQDEVSEVQPSTCSLTLDNSDGLFTYGLAAPPPGSNLLANGSFETDVTGWTGNGDTTLARSTAQAWTGTASLAMTVGATSDAFMWADRVTVIGGQAYTIQARARSATTARAFYFFVKWYDSNGVNLSNNTSGSSTSAPTTSFGFRSDTWTAPAAAVSAEVQMYLTAWAAGNVVYFDAVKFAQESAASNYTEPRPSFPVGIDTGIYVETAIGASFRRRFTGYINTWPLTWPGGNRYAEVQITASDRLARLARRKLRSVPAETIALVSPSVYYPLSERSGSASAGDASGHGAPALQAVQVGTGGTIDFGSGTGPATDGTAAPMFSRVDTANGLYLSAAVPNGIFTGGPDFYVLAVVNTTQMGQTIVRLGSNNYPVELAIDPTTGRPYCNYGTGQVFGSASAADGATHVLLFTWTEASNTGSLYVDNALVGTSTSYYAWPSRWTKVSIGGGDGATSKPAAATISHVAIGERALSSAERGDLYHAMADGFTADSSDARIIRYAGWAGIPDTEIDAVTGSLTSVAHQDTTGASPVGAMQAVATSEQGLLFISGGGRLAFRSRASRYTPTIGATLQAQDIGVDTTFSLDSQNLVNSVTASREGGATQVYEVASSIAKYEQYPADLQLLVTTDDDALLAAAWVANTNAEPVPRLSSVPVDLLTMDATKATSVMFLELGDAFTITGMPAQAPASAVTLFAEGWQESISTDTWSVTFNTSPLNAVWTLEDAVSGRIDSTFRLAY